MKTRLIRFSRSVTFGVLIIFSSIGCEEEITQVELTSNAFSLYGVINPLEEVQALRVFQIDELLELTKAEPIDASVFSMDLDSGLELTWQDSLVQFSGGKYGHVFWAPFKAEHGHHYRLEVIRSDGVKAEVFTEVPPFSDAEIMESSIDGFFVTTPILWRNAPHLINIVVQYFSNAGTFNVHYGLQQETVDGGQLVTIDLRRDVKRIFQMATFLGIHDVILNKIQMSVVVTDENWDPPGGVFDADVFSEPGTFSNVVDGFGFVGSGYSADVDWVPADEILLELGFFLPGG